MADKAIEVPLDEKLSATEAVQENRQRKEASVFNAAHKNPEAFWGQGR